MVTFEEFRKECAPAFRESEKDYFLRIANEYRLLCKREARQQLLRRWANRLNTVIQPLGNGPNLLRTRSF